MRLTLSSREYAQLRTLLNTLLGQFDHASFDEWRGAVTRAFRELCRSDSASFFLPNGNGDAFHVEGIEAKALQEYATYFHSIDPGVEKMRQLGLETYTGARMLATDAETFYGSEVYADWYRPNHLVDAAGIMIASPPGSFGSALLAAYRPSVRRVTFTERDAAIIDLARPAVRAAAMAHAQLGAHRTSLASALDAIQVGVIVFDDGGREIHRNPAVSQLLLNDADAPALLAAIRRLATEAVRRREKKDAGLASGTHPRIASGTCTTCGTYDLGASAVRLGIRDGLQVVITVAARRPQSDSPATLRARYGFTHRECDVALLLARGAGNAEIARSLGVSAHTARHHTEHVFAKLGVHSRAAVPRALDALPSKD